MVLIPIATIAATVTPSITLRDGLARFTESSTATSQESEPAGFG